ncbi:MAG TPA: hemerythrin domain-containing protein [Terriglobia bacterium]|nr:hemerythrin domain-containing protein [Terriglobia bacterium]
MNKHDREQRRNILWGMTAAASGFVISSCSGHREETGGVEKAEGTKEESEEEVSPAEDLMREHGILKRVILVYREAIRRLDANRELPPEALRDSANLIRRFIEDYHEKLEEDFLFPRFRKANTLVELVDTLYTQHRRGRTATDAILRLSTNSALKNPEDRRRLRDLLEGFARMYEPHEAREDTVLFPAFRRIVPAQEYDALGEDFEKKEHQLFGQDGFEKNVEEVARIEKVLGVYDLAMFTPSE